MDKGGDWEGDGVVRAGDAAGVAFAAGKGINAGATAVPGAERMLKEKPLIHQNCVDIWSM